MKAFQTVAALALAASALTLSPPEAAAQPAPVAVFVHVKSVQHYGGLRITGIRQGASQLSTFQLNTSSSNVEPANSCVRFAQTMMAKPGKYELEIYGSGGSTPHYCGLTLVDE